MCFQLKHGDTCRPTDSQPLTQPEAPPGRGPLLPSRPAPSAAARRRCRRRFRTGDGGWRWPPPPPRRGTGRGGGRARSSRCCSARNRRGGTAARWQVRRGEQRGPSREALPGDSSFPRGRPAGGSPPGPRCPPPLPPQGAGGPRGSRGEGAASPQRLCGRRTASPAGGGRASRAVCPR